MHDPRFDTLANLMLNHSLQIKPGDAFNITADINALPLVKALLKAAQKIGAFATVDFTHQEISRHQLGLIRPEDGGQSQAFLERKAAWNIQKFEKLVGEVVIRSYANDQELSAIAPDVRRLDAACAKPFRDLVINHRRWVLFEYPTPGQAQRAGMSSEGYFDFALAVSCVDYAKMQRDVVPLALRMKNAKRVRITGPGTDLRFSVENIPSVPCCGEYNIPDGECFTAPVKDSIEGVLQYNTPSIYWGTTFNNIRFEFKQGQIVTATADQHVEKLNQILDSDPGARYIGEFSLAFNPLIQNPFCNTLFDEKIAGSFHFTPGACYDEAPNGNDSTVHWDLVCIQRPEYGGGEIWFDDELIRRDGLFIPEDLAALNP
ncbi:MAG: aminopeptidase [Eubacteriales bacterium]|nr:aminopeptidase [Eubacteriales bacterium]